MSLLSLVNILAQSLAALVIFVIGYLALLVSAIAALVLASLIYKGARLFWARAIQPALAVNGMPANAEMLPSPSHEGSPRVGRI